MTLIAPSEEYIKLLGKLVVPPETLAKNGYIMQPLTDDELLLKRRCLGCNKTMHQLRVKRPEKNELQQRGKTDNTFSSIGPSQLFIHNGSRITDGQQTTIEAAVLRPPKFRCRYHPGQLDRKVWTCCRRNASAEPCGGADMHVPQAISTDALTTKYQFHSTPPTARMQRSYRIAVALDCEMGTAVSGDSEPIRVTLIDYFSRDILVNKIIVPDVRMHSLNTRYSGVSWDDINKARKQRTCLWGNTGTREALWKYIGPETIVVGHGANNDLRVLRWIHRSVVDSLIIESTRAKRVELKEAAEKKKLALGNAGLNALEDGIQPTPSSAMATGIAESSATMTLKPIVVRKPGQLSLKTLAKLRLDRDIQTGGKKGHDSLEDAVAARDLVHWSIMNPDEEVN